MVIHLMLVFSWLEGKWLGPYKNEQYTCTAKNTTINKWSFACYHTQLNSWKTRLYLHIIDITGITVFRSLLGLPASVE